MAVTIESLVVSTRVDPAGVSRGLAEGARAIEQFVARTGTITTPLVLDFRIAPTANLQALTREFALEGAAAGEAYVAALEQSLQRIAELQPPPIPSPVGASGTAPAAAGASPVVSPTVDSAALEAFAETTQQSLRALTQETQKLVATFNGLGDLVTGFFQGIQEGATEALTEFASGTAQAAASVEVLAPAIGEAATETSRLIAGMSEAGRVTVDASAKMIAGMSESGRAAAAAAANSERIGVAATGATAGVNKLRGGLTSIALHASGSNAAVGQIVSGLLLLGPGSTAVLGVAAGAAVLGTVYNALTKQSRERKKALDDEIKGLLELRDAQRDPVRVAAGIESDVAGRAIELQQEIAEIARQQQAALRAVTDQGFARAITLAGELVELGREYRDVIEAAATATGKTADELRKAADAAREFQEQQLAARVPALAAAPGLGTDNAAVRQQLALEIERQRVIAQTSRVLTERNEAQQRLNQLIAGAVQPTREQADLAQRAATSQLQALQALEQQRQAVAAPLNIDTQVQEVAQGLEAQRATLQANLRSVEAQRERWRGNSEAVKTLTADAEQLRGQIRGIDTALQGLSERAVTDAAQNLETLIQGISRRVQTTGELAIPVQLDATEAFEQAELIKEALQDRIALFRGAGDQVPPGLQQAFDEFEALLQSAIELPVDLLLQGADRVAGRVAATAAVIEASRQVAAGFGDTGPTIGDLADQQRQLQPLLDDIRLRIEAITAALADERTPQVQVNALLEEQARLLDIIAGHQAPTPLEVTQLAPLEQATKQFVEARALFEATQSAEARQAVDAAAANMDRIRESILDTIKAMGLEGATVLRIVEAIEEAYRKAGRAAGDLSEGNRQLLAIIGGAGDIAGALARAGDQAGIFTDDTIKAFDDLNAVIQDTQALAASIMSGNPLAIAISGINLVGSIGGALGLGQSAEEKAAEQASRELKTAIDRLTREVGNIDFDITGTTFSGLEKAFGVITDPSRFLLQDNTKLGLRVEDLLEGFGLTIDDVKAAAQEMGIEFNNNADFYRQFNEALKQIELTQFAETFGGQRDLLTRGFDILGITDPGEQFQQFGELVSSEAFGSPALREALAGIDLSTQEGIELARERLRDVFRNFENLKPEDLGGLTPEEFLDSLAQGTDLATQALNELVGGAADATKSLSNIPEFFNLGAAEAAVRDRRITDTTAGFKPFDGPLVNLELDRISLERFAELLGGGSDGAALPLAHPLGGGPGEAGGAERLTELLEAIGERQRRPTFSGNEFHFHLPEDPNRDAGKLFREFQELLEQEQLATTGTPE